MSDQLEIHKLMVLSTCHITLRASGFLPVTPQNIGVLPYDPLERHCIPGGHVDSYEYGWHIALTGEKEPEEQWPDPSLQDVCAYAEKHGCTHLRLDRDGPTMSDLPTYNW